MPLKAKIRYPAPDKQATTAAIHKQMTDAVIDAARRFVLGAAGQVPVWTGASKASFLKLAHEAKVALSIAPRAPVNRIPLGTATSTGTITTRRGEEYSFKWASRLNYIHIVERHNGFVEAGINAVRRAKLAKLPQPITKRQGPG